jgi:hypothetical protein
VMEGEFSTFPEVLGGLYRRQLRIRYEASSWLDKTMDGPLGMVVRFSATKDLDNG